LAFHNEIKGYKGEEGINEGTERAKRPFVLFRNHVTKGRGTFAKRGSGTIFSRTM
jgi:hypothetical protein